MPPWPERVDARQPKERRGEVPGDETYVCRRPLRPVRCHELLLQGSERLDCLLRLQGAQDEMRGEIRHVNLPVPEARGVEIEEPDRRRSDQNLLVVEVAVHKRRTARSP